MKNRKDVTEKALEAYNDVFADIVNVLIYKGEEVVSENELEQGKDRSVYAGEKDLREQERDTTRYWKQNNIRIAMFGIENETEPEDDMPFRIIGYDGAAYRDQIRYEKAEGGKRKKVLDRYPVITLVLYMGYEKRWDKAKSIYEVLGDRVDPAFGKYVHNYPINLFEIAFLPDEVVSAFKSDFRFVADYFVQMRKTGTYTGSNEEMVHVKEVTQLLTALTNDIRFAEAVTEAENEGHILSALQS